MSEWGPWIKHDGVRRALIVPRTIHAVFLGNGIRPPDEEAVYNWPGWSWSVRKVRVGWFRREWRIVCDDPAYAPIIRYRIRRPQALRDLIRIAESPREVEPA